MIENNFEWCGLHWESCMEGGRIIHPEEPWMWYDSEMAKVLEDGTLELNAAIKPKDVEYYDGSVYHPTYAVGNIQSQETFLYGKFSCDIEMPDGTNCWPAFWLTGADFWPPEIDIAEAWSDSSGDYFTLTIPQFPYLVPSWDITNNVHYLNKYGYQDSVGSRSISICKLCHNPKTHFVNYACIWEPNKITILVNGKKVRTLKNIPNVDIPMRVVFDLRGQEEDFAVIQPMKCRNFKYEPLS